MVLGLAKHKLNNLKNVGFIKKYKLKCHSYKKNFSPKIWILLWVRQFSLHLTSVHNSTVRTAGYNWCQPGVSFVNEISQFFRSPHLKKEELWLLAHVPLLCKRAVGKNLTFEFNRISRNGKRSNLMNIGCSTNETYSNIEPNM
jgi:hypothetical protein